MDQKTIVLVMSLGDKTGVQITVLTIFGRFDKRWRLHLVYLFSLCINIDIKKKCSAPYFFIDSGTLMDEKTSYT